MMVSKDLILVERIGHIVEVILNRPEKLNAFTLAMWEELGEAMAKINADKYVRCVVFRGAPDIDGRVAAFAAGADIREFSELRSNATQAKDYARRMEPAILGVKSCPHPTLAIIEGACMGGGLELAIECDLRICGRSAKFGIPINRLGHVLPMQGMQALVELVGRAVAMEILLEGRILSAEEAYVKGLANRVVEDDQVEEEGGMTAERIALSAPLAARWHKSFARRVLDSKPLTTEERDAPFASCDTADYREGVRAFLAKEKPVFKGE